MGPTVKVGPFSVRMGKSRLFDEGHEFGADAGIGAEGAEDGGGDGDGVLFFDAAHHHAEVGAAHDDADALGAGDVLDGMGDLFGEALLDLEAAGEAIDDAGDLAEADDVAVGDVADVATSVEGQEMVLDTLEGMKAARHLYDKFGFELCEAYYHNPMPDVLYMRKSLQSPCPSQACREN